jgi:hypothetical protein
MPHLHALSQRVARVLALTAFATLIVSTDVLAQANNASSSARVLSGDAGVILHFIKADKAADFETVMGKLREALEKSDKPERKQQAAGWKIYRAAEPGPNGSVLFVFVIDPAVKGADYTVSTILSEAFPSEAQELYQKYATAYASGQNILNLTTLAKP